MRWKAHLNENNWLNTLNPFSHIFKSGKRLAWTNKSVKFKKVKNKFLDQLNKDLSSIKKSKNVFIFADKTRNIYETDKNTYSKLLTDSISKNTKNIIWYIQQNQ